MSLRSGIELEGFFPVLVKRLEAPLEFAVAILSLDGFPRVAPGRRLSEQALHLGDLRFKLTDLALDLIRLAIRKSPLLPLGRRRYGRRHEPVDRGWASLGFSTLRPRRRLLLLLNEALEGLVIPLDHAGAPVRD